MERPKAFLLRIMLSEGMPLSERSRGMVICCSISSAARPGTWVTTWTVTSAMSG